MLWKQKEKDKQSEMLKILVMGERKIEREREIERESERFYDAFQVSPANIRLGLKGLPGACIIKLITAVIYIFCNKLECLSLASLSSLI
jgi:hypothetical protein